MRLSRGEAPARAALVGNPSDGFGGRTLALALAGMSARAVVYEWPELELLPGRGDLARFADLDHFLADARAHGHEGGLRLVRAAVRCLHEHCVGRGQRLEATFSVRYESDIPRGVGLAGSSAIVCATLRALTAFHRVALSADELAALALRVEAGELGLAAGPQDRLVQAHGGLLLMDFAPEHVGPQRLGRCERLDPALLPPLFLAYLPGAAEPSHGPHGELRRRWEAGEEGVAAAMVRLGDLAVEARDRLLAGAAAQLGELIDLGFEERRRLMDLDPRHVELVQIARRLGASAGFAGSGGAVIGTCRDARHRAQLAGAYAQAGAVLVEPEVAPGAGRLA